MKLLFVCLGNICRSPSAEAIMNSVIAEAGLENEVSCDSAGTCAHHVGELADARMRQHASRRGTTLTSISHQFIEADFNRFDYIIAMDQSNYRNIIALASTETERDKVVQMTDYSSDEDQTSIPDPYYGGERGFELVLDLLEDCCHNFLAHLQLGQ